MKLVVSLVFFLSTIAAFSQEVKTSKPKIKVGKVSVGINFSPGVAFRTYQLTSHDPEITYVHHFFDSIEKPKFGFTTGLNVVVELTNHIGLQTGLQYANQGMQSIWYSTLVLSNSGQYYGKARYSYTYHNLNIPVRVNFKLGSGKIYFLGSAGLNWEILVARGSEAQISDSTGHVLTLKHTATDVGNYLHRFNLSGIVSAGIGYDINKLHSLRFEPSFQHQVLSLYTGDNIKTYLWSAGLNVAYYFAVK